MILETPRLVLREYAPEDFEWLHPLFSDPEMMAHYPHPFSEEETRQWIARNMARYQKDGFGLWVVELRESGRPIGDCGLTMQNINGAMLPEIGYHIARAHQRKGYAAEAAGACKRWAFTAHGFPALYSYCKCTNLPSQRTALKNGMRFVEEYADPVNIFTRVYRITREEWLAEGITGAK